MYLNSIRFIKNFPWELNIFYQWFFTIPDRCEGLLWTWKKVLHVWHYYICDFRSVSDIRALWSKFLYIFYFLQKLVFVLSYIILKKISKEAIRIVTGTKSRLENLHILLHTIEKGLTIFYSYFNAVYDAVANDWIR